MYRFCTISLLSLFCFAAFTPSQAEACGMYHKKIAKKEVKKDLEKEGKDLRAAALKSMFDLIDEAEAEVDQENTEDAPSQDLQEEKTKEDTSKEEKVDKPKT